MPQTTTPFEVGDHVRLNEEGQEAYSRAILARQGVGYDLYNGVTVKPDQEHQTYKERYVCPDPFVIEEICDGRDPIVRWAKYCEGGRGVYQRRVELVCPRTGPW